MSGEPPVRTGTRIHRLEHGLLALGLAGALGWLLFAEEATTLGRVLFWAVAPDLAFIPIALGSRQGAWPPWGAAIYNATHTYLVMLPTLAIASFLQGHVVWPLLAWAFHVELDRALGFDLRAMRPPPRR